MSEERERTSSDDYAANCGIKCPFCDSLGIEGGPVEIDAGYATQEARCVDCGKTWFDQYKLIGYSF